MPRRFAWMGICVALAPWSLSCAAKKIEPEPVAVRGKVQTAGGKAVRDMVLIFYPLEETNRSQMPSCLLDKEGRFEGRLKPGRYKATLAPIPAGGGGPAGGADAGPGKAPAKAGRPDVLTRYRDRDQSPWEVTIPEVGKDDIVLTVE